MNIKKLQEELVEKISLISIEDNRSNLERTLEIINQLGKDHINDIITTVDKKFTALGCVITFDSQGINPRSSRRPRLNNRMLKELETTIRDTGGKTSEELELVQIEASTHRETLIDFNTIGNNGANEPLANLADNHVLTLLHSAVRDDDFNTVRFLVERGANIDATNINGETFFDIAMRVLIECISTNLEGITVQSSIEGRENRP